MGVLCGALLMGTLAGCDDPEPRAEDGRIPIQVYMLLISTEQVEYYKWAEKVYEERNPNIDIIIEQFPGSSLKDFEVKLRLRFSSGQAPDVFFVHSNVTAELVDLGLLDPAPPFVEELVQEESRNAMIREAPYFDGTLYGMVADATPTVLYYNRDMFQEAGLDPDRPPQNWEELLDYADRLTVRDEDGEVTRAGLSLRKRGFKPGTAEKWLTFLYSAGGAAFNEAGTHAAFNSDAGREALQFYKEVLFDRNIDSIDLEGDQQGFGQKRAAMFIREVHVIRWLNRNYPDLNYDVATLPKRDTSLSSGAPYLWNVPKQSDHPEEAWRFIEFLMSEEAYERYASIGGVIPVTKSVASKPEFSEDPHLQVFLDQEMKASVFPHVGRAKSILGAYIERFSYGRMSIDETLNRAESDVNALLLRNRDEIVQAYEQ